MRAKKTLVMLFLLAALAALLPAAGSGGAPNGAFAASISTLAQGPGQSPESKPRPDSAREVVMLVAGGDVGGRLFHLVPNALFVSSTDAAQVYEPRSGRLEPTRGRLHDSREGATATLLADGKLLIAGGLRCVNGIFGSRCAALDTAELYDPASGRFVTAGAGSGGKMSSARAGHSATLILGCNCAADGKVLLAGGISGSIKTTLRGIVSSVPLATAELYDPVKDAFVAVKAKMKDRRQNHCAAPLVGGQVLIAGGDDAGYFEHALAAAEIYDPKTNSFLPAGTMQTARELAQATTLERQVVKGSLAGDVLISGGLVASGRLMGDSSSTAELYDPRAKRFIAIASHMSSPRTNHSAVLLASGPLAGTVLIAGGIQLRGDGTARGVRQVSYATADIYDPSVDGTGEFRPTGDLNEARGGHAFALLSGGPNSGEVLVVGGENCDGKSPSFCYIAGSPEDRAARNPGVGAELYDPITGAWTPLRATMPTPVSAAAYGAVSR